MFLEHYDIITTKLNMFQFPDVIKNNEPFLIKVNVNLEISSFDKNNQKVILTYNVKSSEFPIYMLWECTCNLSFDEDLNSDMTEEEFFEYTDVISEIDSNVKQICELFKIDLPLFSKIIGGQHAV